jgi:hypothetical protein
MSSKAIKPFSLDKIACREDFSGKQMIAKYANEREKVKNSHFSLWFGVIW